MHRYYPEIMPLISEGDSWFSYPLVGANLMDQLVLKFEGCINYLRLENNGDEATEIFANHASGQLRTLLKHVRTFQVPVVLLSAGGNDVVGESNTDLFDHALDASDVATLIGSAGLKDKLIQIKSSYELAIAALVAVKPDIKIIAHSYDYPIVNAAHAPITVNSLGLIAPVVNVMKQVGPWISPILEAKGLTDSVAQQQFAVALIDHFHDEVLMPLKNQFGDNFDFVDLRGTLELKAHNWNDEIHPSAAGFELLANKFWLHLRPVVIDAYGEWQSI